MSALSAGFHGCAKKHDGAYSAAEASARGGALCQRLTCDTGAKMLAFSGIATPTVSLSPKLPALKAAVIVPGFLSDESDFYELAEALSADGIATAVVPMKLWHWIPILGGRSVRPLLDRIAHAVEHVAAVHERVAPARAEGHARARGGVRARLHDERAVVRARREVDDDLRERRGRPELHPRRPRRREVDDDRRGRARVEVRGQPRAAPRRNPLGVVAPQEDVDDAQPRSAERNCGPA